MQEPAAALQSYRLALILCTDGWEKQERLIVQSVRKIMQEFGHDGILS